MRWRELHARMCPLGPLKNRLREGAAVSRIAVFRISARGCGETGRPYAEAFADAGAVSVTG